MAAITSINYLTFAVANQGFQQALVSALVFGFIIMGLIYTFVRGKNPEYEAEAGANGHASTKELLEMLMSLLKSKQMWLIGIIGCLLYLPATVFVDQWGIPYLEQVHGLSPAEAARSTSLILLGWLISSPIIGWYSDKINRRCMPLIVTSMIACAGFFLIFYSPFELSRNAIYALMLLVGAACGSHPLCFSLSKENNMLRFSGTAIAVTNAMIMLGGVFQYVVGKFLDLHFSGYVEDGIRVYSKSDYTFALSIIPIGFIISILISFFIKETHCQLKEEL